MCTTLEVSRSGFYAWLRRGESERSRENRRLTEVIREEHERSRRTYGSPRIHAALKARGETCGLNRVALYECDVVRVSVQGTAPARERGRADPGASNKHCRCAPLCFPHPEL